MFRLIGNSSAVLASLLLAIVSVCADDANEALFVRRISPLLQEKCLACHGRDAENIEGGLDLRGLGAAIAGGDSEIAAITPGRPDESPMYLAAAREHDEWSAMPPKDAQRLSSEQLLWLRDWIAAGADWPSDDRVSEISRSFADAWSSEDGVLALTSGGLSPEWTNRRYKPEGLWAYQPVSATIDLEDQTHHWIDRSIAKRMPAGLEPAPIADRTTLIRRATFDLTGLPPTPAEVLSFKYDPLPDDEAFQRVVNRLLDSPHYGERMAQHWLDVVRYADSSGFANDFERGNAWRYRDYVIRSFNDDTPYNQFIREQIAGDEIDPENPELLVATGFLRMGPWELTGMEVARIARQRFLDDVTNSVGETFLAHSLQCARCHDHKFDPVPTRDYYSIQAVFATTQLVEREASFLPCENFTGFDEVKYLLARKDELQQTIDRLTEKITVQAGRKWLEENGLDASPFENAIAELTKEDAAQAEKQQKAKENRQPKEITLARIRKWMQEHDVHPDLIPPKQVGFTPDDFGNERVARKGLERLKWELDRYEPYALAVYNGATPEVKSVFNPVRMPQDPMSNGELEKSFILNGGDPFSAGEPVTPNVLSILGGIQRAAIPETVSGRRLAFADWVADENNPLTTRAIVNRIWMWHFNQAIAGNPNNFGSTGKSPTHPELLDWLAVTFVDDGWSFKSMHRRIMSSEAYRRSSSHSNPQQVTELDPTSSSYAVFQPRRLTSEELRDSILAVTGELNPELGGIPVRPEINLEAAMQPRQVMGTFAAAWTPNPHPKQRNRRSIYTLKLRGLVDPMLEVFNSPSPDFSCERREASTVTPQVFSLFNSQMSYARSLALANRVVSETECDSEAIIRCFQLAYSRMPMEDEIAACVQHCDDIEKTLSDNAVDPLPPALKVRRDAVEENTGEHFSFEEMLYSNQDFVPDLRPSEVSKHVRAMADVCLAIFNSNEFIYVY